MTEKRALWLILALSVGLRLAAALYLGPEVRPTPGAFDQLSYDALAQRVAGGQGFSFADWHWPYTRPGAPTAHWSYLYTGLLAGLYALGLGPLAARLLQAVVVGILHPWGAWRLGRRLFGPGAGLAAAGATAVYLYFVYYSATLMTEMLTITAAVWLLDTAVALARRPSWGRWAAFGGLAGVLALLRQVALLPVPLVGLWLLLRRAAARDLGRALAGTALAAGIALLLIAPATLRNQRAFGRFVPLSTNAGYAFFWANHPVHGDRFQELLPEYQALIPEALRDLDEAALGDALLAEGLGFVRQDPGRYLRLSLSRVPSYFRFWPSAESSALSNASRVLSFALFLPFMLAGLWLSRRLWREAMPLYLYAGGYALLHLASWALIRYRLPVDAVLLVFAGVALAAMGTRLPRLGPWLAGLDEGERGGEKDGGKDGGKDDAPPVPSSDAPARAEPGP